MGDVIWRKEIVDGNRTVELEKRLHEVVTEDGWPLIVTHKIPRRARMKRTPVMLVHGLGQNRFSWHLSRRSLENHLVSQGFETYNVELRGHGLSRAAGSEAPENFEAYLRYDIPACVRMILKTSGVKKIFYMGHSLGGILSYCLEEPVRDAIAGIVSIAGPYTFAAGNPVMRVLARLGVAAADYTFIPRILPSYFYVDFLGIGVRAALFALDNPHVPLHLRIWYPGSIERDLLVERIEKGFDRTSMTVFDLLLRWAATGRLRSTDGQVDFSRNIDDMDLPILFVVGANDDVVPPESVVEGYRRVGSRDKTLQVFNEADHGTGWGHCDLICGQHASAHVWPCILDWLKSRDPRPSERSGRGRRGAKSKKKG
ncbi:alpha/beta fold hydrolase [Thermodesulfobacteriota bacterium]